MRSFNTLRQDYIDNGGHKSLVEFFTTKYMVRPNALPDIPNGPDANLHIQMYLVFENYTESLPPLRT